MEQKDEKGSIEKPRKKVFVEEVDEKTESSEKAEAVEQKPGHMPKPADSPQDLPEPPHFTMLFIIVPGIIILLALIGGIIVYEGAVSKTKSVNKPANEALATPSYIPLPTPTPNAQDLTKYTISIQNGSGIPGEGGKAKTMLEGAGFKVGFLGNAQSYDYTNTVIQAKATVDKDFVNALVSALSKVYKVKEKVDSIPEAQSDTIIVIVGSSKI